MTDHRALKAALADKLLAVTADQAAAERRDLPTEPRARDAALALNAIRCVIGQAVARHPPGEERDILKIALATALGDPLGQLLAGQSDRRVAAALEGAINICGGHLGTDTRINVAITAPLSSTLSHLKVVQ